MVYLPIQSLTARINAPLRNDGNSGPTTCFFSVGLGMPIFSNWEVVLFIFRKAINSTFYRGI